MDSTERAHAVKKISKLMDPKFYKRSAKEIFHVCESLHTIEKQESL